MHVLFTQLNLHDSDGETFVPYTEFNPYNTRATIKHDGRSVIVKGHFSIAGIWNIYLIDAKMDRFQYLQMLKQSAEELNKLDKFAFYKDDNPKHIVICC